MGRVRYIGSKARIAQQLANIIGNPACPGMALLDVFAGTGIISREAALRGWQIIANDHLLSSAVTTAGQLTSGEDVGFEALGGYLGVLRTLNVLPGVTGFITREYAPSGESSSGHERRYFSIENAQRIDAIRLQIARWAADHFITPRERMLLLADLLSAANVVANIAGTYGCFLREWGNSSKRLLTLAPRDLLKTAVRFEVLNRDAFSLGDVSCEVAYVDPPYTKRQYAAYYHVLETIAHGDEPVVDGVTGLRPWQDKLSPFCYRVRALKALGSLISSLSTKRVVLSYSSEGHLPMRQIEELFSGLGNFATHSIPEVGRYRPNSKARDNSPHVTEFVMDLALSAGKSLVTA